MKVLMLLGGSLGPLRLVNVPCESDGAKPLSRTIVAAVVKIIILYLISIPLTWTAAVR
jgi:hypothetical protein